MAVIRRGERHSGGGGPAPKKGAILLTRVVDDIKALNSSVSLISQKMKHLVRNEKILGRNLIVLNKKMKTITEQKDAGEVPENLQQDLEALAKKIDANSVKLDDLAAQLGALKNDFVSSEDLKELRYVIDSINPLEFVTVEQAKELIDERISKQKKKAEQKA